MEIVFGDLLTVEGKKYMTLATLNHDGNKYAFVNKIIGEEEITNEYYIFKLLNDGIRVVLEEDLRNILIPKFQEILKQNINELLKD